MIRKNEYPILEFDDTREALITPQTRAASMLPNDKLIITFFAEVIHQLLEEKRIEYCTAVRGENEVALYRFVDDGVLLMHGLIGCPGTAGYMDCLTGMGIQKVLFCGGGGALEKGIHVGQLFVVEGAIRDEGFSYHYVEPSRIIYAQSDVRETICAYLSKRDIKYTEGLCWTTDCIYRETKELIQYRNQEGAKIVEMEQSGCIAVAQFRGIKYGAIIYGGDDVSKNEWDKRIDQDRKGVRYALVDICRELVKQI